MSPLRRAICCSLNWWCKIREAGTSPTKWRASLSRGLGLELWPCRTRARDDDERGNARRQNRLAAPTHEFPSPASTNYGPSSGRLRRSLVVQGAGRSQTRRSAPRDRRRANGDQRRRLDQDRQREVGVPAEEQHRRHERGDPGERERGGERAARTETVSAGVAATSRSTRSGATPAPRSSKRASAEASGVASPSASTAAASAARSATAAWRSASAANGGSGPIASATDARQQQPQRIAAARGDAPRGRGSRAARRRRRRPACPPRRTPRAAAARRRRRRGQGRSRR